MTGLLGGGHAIYWDAAEERAQNLDFFVSVPGLGGERERHMELVGVPFGEELIHYAIGPARAGFPGCRRGSTRSGARTDASPGRASSSRRSVSRATARFPTAHAACLVMLAPVFTMSDGARIYSPGGDLLQAGDSLQQPGLVRALDLLAEEGARLALRRDDRAALLALSDERGGARSPAADLDAYEARGATRSGRATLDARRHARRALGAAPRLARLPQLAG